MSSTLLERPPLRPERAERLRSRERRRKAAALASVAVCVIALAGSAFLLANPDLGRHRAAAPVATDHPRHTAVLSLEGTPVPLVAVVGGGSGAVAIPLPPDLTASLPGRGEIDTATIAALPGPSLRIDLSNVMGMWIEHYAAIDLDGLAAAVQRAGGLSVDLPEPFPVGGTSLGPGVVVMNGAQVRAYVSASAPGAAAVHWDVMLSAILADPPSFTDADLADSDGARALNQTLAGATDPQVLTFPSRFVSATVTVPDFGAIDALVATRFGARQPPVPVEVLNGSGDPEAAEIIAAKLVPAGFRITLDETNRDFAREPTRVIADGNENLAAAQRAHQALGFGRLAITRVPSGLGDVTIVLGRDFRT